MEAIDWRVMGGLLNDDLIPLNFVLERFSKQRVEGLVEPSVVFSVVEVVKQAYLGDSQIGICILVG